MNKSMNECCNAWPYYKLRDKTWFLLKLTPLLQATCDNGEVQQAVKGMILLMTASLMFPSVRDVILL